jgi:hypothetical protein
MAPLRRARIHDCRVHKKFESPATEAIAYDKHSLFWRPTCRYAATNFDLAEAGPHSGCARRGRPAMADQEQTLLPHKTRDQDFACGPSAHSAHLEGDKTPAKRLRLSKNAGSCCLGSRRPATTKHTVTILLCICQAEFTPKLPAETGV